MRLSTRPLLLVTVSTLALVSLAWLVSSVSQLHDRIAELSPELAAGVIAVVAVGILIASLAGGRLLWKMGHGPAAPSPALSKDVVQAAQTQIQQAQQDIARISDQETRQQLSEDIARLQNDYQKRNFHVVIFGTASAGKTSLINALLGEKVAETAAPMGTTRQGQRHDHRLQGVEGTLILTDTPGISEASASGEDREAEARELATTADLLLFVVDHDLVRSEFEPLSALLRQGKRSIVVFNKKDRFPEEDASQILLKLRDRLRGILDPADVVAIAADPRAVPFRVVEEDGGVHTALQSQSPDLGELEARVVAILKREGQSLRAGNLLLRAFLVGKQAREQLVLERKAKAESIIDRFQWITAGALFANPLPALDLLAAGAVRVQMVTELAGLYGVELSTSHVKTIAQHLASALLKLGLVETATSLLAGFIKLHWVGFLAGGTVQAVTGAYLTHIAGHALADYFERGQSWGDGGVQSALMRQFSLNQRGDFLAEFVKQAYQKLATSVTTGAAATPRGGPVP